MKYKALYFDLFVGLAAFVIIAFTTGAVVGRGTTLSVDPRASVTLTLPRDVAEVLNTDNTFRGVQVGYVSTDGTVKLVQYSGTNYEQVHTFVFEKGK